MGFNLYRLIIYVLTTALFFINLGASTANVVQTIVVDRREKQPVTGASVFSARGLIMGITDDKGQVPQFDKHDFPLSVRSVGFKEATLTAPVDTLFMEEEEYNLPEFTVSTDERPVVQVIAYVREYCTGAMAGDTLQYYSDYMMRSFLTDRKKVKGYHESDANARVLNTRKYCRYINEIRDSVAIPTDMENFLSWNRVVGFNGRVEEPDTIRNGARTDTVQGKYSPILFYEKSPRTFTRTKDNLGNHKGHIYSPAIFKLLGLTVDATQLQLREVYVANESGIYGPGDLISEVFNIHMRGRGKLWRRFFRSKVPVEMDSYIEVYPVEVTYLTITEYKEERKNNDTIPFRTNENVPGLLPSIQKMVDRVNSLHR